MKQWECSVCGYIHTGEAPPDECPRCGADRSQFVEISTDDAERSVPETTTAPPASFNRIAGIVWKLHIHPIAVHIPNGVLPLSVFFLFIAAVFNLDEFSVAARCNMIFVVLAMPVVLISGYIDWKNRFGRKLTRLFIIKITCGFIVLGSSILSTGWQIFNPEAIRSASSGWLFFLLQLIMLGAAVLAGYCGGKLVFEKN